MLLHSDAEPSFACEAASKSGNESSFAGELSKTKGGTGMIVWIAIAIAMLVNACCISEEEYSKIQEIKDTAFLKYWNS